MLLPKYSEKLTKAKFVPARFLQIHNYHACYRFLPYLACCELGFSKKISDLFHYTCYYCKSPRLQSICTKCSICIARIGHGIPNSTFALCCLKCRSVMSGYRSLHREQILPDTTSIWCCRCTRPYRIWMATSDGNVRLWQGIDKQTKTNDSDKDTSTTELDASAVSLQCTHILSTESPSVAALGCCVVDVTRNYVGEDDDAGDILVISLELHGRIRIWNFDDSFLNNQNVETEAARTSRSITKALETFTVENATGTTAALASPRLSCNLFDVACIAVGLLDGTIAIISTGVAIPNQSNTPSSDKDPKCAAGGTVLDVWGNAGSAVPLCLVWNPLQSATLAVGRQDGSVDILRPKKRQSQSEDPRYARHATTSLHHLAGHAVRALAYTPDGCLLVAGNDAGAITVWDVELSSSTSSSGGLVHHITNAHKHWICNIHCIDNQRFVSIGTDKQIHVWQFRELYRPVHRFHLDHSVWGSHVLMDASAQSSTAVKRNLPKLVTGSDTGWIQIFSLE